MSRVYVLADVIFPAPSAVYVTTLFVPVATILALATEFMVYRRCWRGSISAGRLLGLVLVLNLISWVAGFMLSSTLPTGLVPKLVDAERNLSVTQFGPAWGRLAVLGFVLACAASIVIEYAGFRLMCRRSRLRSPLLWVSVANIAGYLVLIATVVVFGYLDSV